MTVITLLTLSCTKSPNVGIHQNKETGLLTYTVKNNGLSIEFIQLLPDFIRAIYGSHQFPSDEIETIASFCVFGTIIKNTSNGSVSYHVADWHFVSDGKKHPVKTKTQWIEQWRQAGINFSWTLLPDVSHFEVGDWQQGFTTIETMRKKPFDLVYTWKMNGEEHTSTIKNMACAPATLSENE